MEVVHAVLREQYLALQPHHALSLLPSTAASDLSKHMIQVTAGRRE